MKPKLNVKLLCKEAHDFAKHQSMTDEPSLLSVTDGKAIGTYIEHKFRKSLSEKYLYEEGNSAQGIDFPGIGVDIKVTSITQPQSSCPYKSAKQKIYGLGYSLLVFVYAKTDNHELKAARLKFLHVIYIDKERTADYQTSTGLRRILENGGNADDLVAFMQERFLPVDGIQAQKIADELLVRKPEIGYLTVSNALQWRL